MLQEQKVRPHILLRFAIDVFLSSSCVITSSFLLAGIVFGLGFWELIYNGTQTSFQDRGLTTFTTYLYRVTTFNQIGFVTSDASEEATTLAGFPLQAGTLTAVALDHVNVLVDWTTPCKSHNCFRISVYHQPNRC